MKSDRGLPDATGRLCLELSRVRRGHRLSQSELARRIGISRQALGAIERGEAAPGVDVALRIAAHLGTDVETLFAPWLGKNTAAGTGLAEGNPEGNPVLAGSLAARVPGSGGVRVLWARIFGRLVLREAPVDGPADAILYPRENGTGPDAGPEPGAGPLLSDRGSERALSGCLPVLPRSFALRPLADAPDPERTLWIAGCDPAAGLLARALEAERPGLSVRLFPLGSESALRSFTEGTVHAAGLHLFDRAARSYNQTRMVEAAHTLGHDLVAYTYVAWEEGLARSRGSSGPPRPEHTDARWGLRPEGSEARALWTRTAEREGWRLPRPGRVVVGRTHIDVAHLLAEDSVDFGIILASLAVELRLPFRPLAEERYELLVHRDDSFTREALARALPSRDLRRQVSCLPGYDPLRMGEERLIRTV